MPGLESLMTRTYTKFCIIRIFCKYFYSKCSLLSGIYVLISGLRIAYLSGKYIPDVYKIAKGAEASGGHFEDDVDALRAIADEKDVIDIFLSYPLLTVTR